MRRDEGRGRLTNHLMSAKLMKRAACAVTVIVTCVEPSGSQQDGMNNLKQSNEGPAVCCGEGWSSSQRAIQTCR
jgi:hypothetical protein